MIDPDDYDDIRRESYEARRMIAEMRELLEKFNAAWDKADTEAIFDICDSDLQEMLQRFEPKED